MNERTSSAVSAASDRTSLCLVLRRGYTEDVRRHSRLGL